jgi:hypothetical protein
MIPDFLNYYRLFGKLLAIVTFIGLFLDISKKPKFVTFFIIFILQIILK